MPVGSAIDGYTVVTTSSGRYSVWPSVGQPPIGWRSTGFRGTETECLDRIADEWRDVRPPRGTASGGQTIHGLVRRHTIDRPRARALRWQGTTTSYEELYAASGRLVVRLRAAGVGPGDVVVVRMPRSPGMVAALLAVLRCGGAYVAVPIEWPTDRVARLCRQCACTVVVDAEPDAAHWPSRVVGAAVSLEQPVSWPAAEVADTADPEMACVFFTSGSTGEPKGACCPHAAITGLLHNAEFVQLGPSTATLQAAALPWDAFALELWGALVNGGCCVLGPAGPLSPSDLRTAVRRDGVNTVFLTSSLFNTLLDVDPTCFAAIDTLLTGGERLSVPHVRRFMELYPGTALINAYGPVEATIFTTTHRIRDVDVAARTAGIPIGRAVRGAIVRVYDESGRPCRPGGTGELYVSGRGLCYGYLGNPRETARKFVPVADADADVAYRTGDLVTMDEDGTLRYVGRVDRQVKLRGVRIEPGEVEAALRECAGVADAAVVKRCDRSGTVVDLYGWYTGQPSDQTALRRELLRRLPAAFVPSTLTHLEELPRGASGKVDLKELERRAALTEQGPPASPGQEADEDADVIRQAVMRTMSEVLGQPVTRADKSFLELGGTSLSAIVLAGRLSESTGRRVRTEAVLASPDAATLAAAVRDASPTTSADSAAAEVSAGQRRLWLADQFTPGDPLLLVHRLFEVTGEIDARVLALALADVAAVHPALRNGLAESARGLTLLPLPLEEATAVTVVPAVGDGEELLSRPETWLVGLSGPTIRLSVAPVSGHTDRFLLALVAHHAFVDGWSLRILQRDLSLAYRERREGRLPRLPGEVTGYARWAAAQNCHDRTGAAEFWRGELTGVRDFVWPPPRPLNSHGLTVRPVEVPTALRQAGRRRGTTVSALLLAAMSAALYQVTGCPDMCVAVPVAGRDEPGVHRTIGFFVDTVPVRLQPHSPDPMVSLPHAHQALLRSLRHPMPFDEIVAALGTARSERPTLCQIAVLRHLHPDAGLDLDGASVHVRPPPPSGGAYELMLELWPTSDGGWQGSLQYRADIVPAYVGEAVHNALVKSLAALGAPILQ